MIDHDIEEIAEILIRFGGGELGARARQMGDSSAVDKLAFVVNLTLDELAVRTKESERQIEALDERTRELETQQRELEATNQSLFEARERLHHMGKLGALGELSAMLAHELAQPLTAIGINAGVLDGADASLTEEQRAALRDMTECAARMHDVVDNLTRFSRDDALSPRPPDPRAPLDAALPLFKQQFHRHAIRCSVRAPYGLPEVLIDASFTQQVFVNLLANARDALSSLPEGLPRRLDIDLGADTEAVVYRIRNCGPVISADDRARIFDAFFTTKGADTGTGLGLALSRDVIQRQGGAIELSPDPVTCFIVRLPTVESSRSG